VYIKYKKTTSAHYFNFFVGDDNITLNKTTASAVVVLSENVSSVLNKCLTAV
jgi:hypothetical protein